MRRWLAWCAGSVAFATLALGQAPSSEFDAASIKPADPAQTRSYGCRGGPGTGDPVLWSCQNVTLVDLVELAFDQEADRIRAPEWANSALFDVTARVPAGATDAAFRSMLSRLLSERFHLVTHREESTVRMYDLLVAKAGAKLKTAAPVEPSTPSRVMARPNPRAVDAGGFALADTPGIVNLGGHAKYYRPSESVPALAKMLKMRLGTPVRDATGLAGLFEIRLRWLSTEDPNFTAHGAVGPDLPRALEEQLGLRLNATKGTVENLVIDAAERKPI